jgi:hypothetical protein
LNFGGYLALFPSEGNPPDTAQTLFEGWRFSFFFPALAFRFLFGPFGTA